MSDLEKTPREAKSSPIPGGKKEDASSDKPPLAEPARATYSSEQAQPESTSGAQKGREGGAAPGPQIAVAQPYLLAVPAAFSDTPVACECHSCHQQIVTSLRYQNGTLTWLMCILCCCLTLICFWIPFVFHAFKDVVHACPRCGAVIGKYQRI